MFNRIQYTALALSAAIVAAGLGATDASAHGFGGFGGRGGFGGGSFGRVSHDPIGGGISRTASSFHVVTRLPPPVPIHVTPPTNNEPGPTPVHLCVITDPNCHPTPGPVIPPGPPVNPPGPPPGPFPGGPVGWKHHPHWWIGAYPVAIDAPAVVADPVDTVAAAPCTCLTKRYLQDGSVLFTDVCTKEQAMATPDELKAQAQAQGQTSQAN
jgi:hypothetical protein